MKQYSVIRTMVAIFIVAFLSFTHLFGDTNILTGSQVLVMAAEKIQANQVPLEIYPTGYFDWLYEIGDEPIPQGKSSKLSKNSSSSMLQESGESMSAQSLFNPVTQKFQVVDLGTLGGNYSSAWGINDQGQVVGQSFLSGDNVLGAFSWKNGAMQNLGSLGGGYAVARSVNNNGQVVGASHPSQGQTRPFRYSGGSMQNLGTLGAASYAEAEAFDINNSGVVVGWSPSTNYSGDRAFLYDGSMHNLGTLGGSSSQAYGINDLGHVVGYSLRTNGDMRAFRYSGGVMSDIGTLGGSYGLAIAINNNSQITGYSETSGGNTRAFLWSNGSMENIGAFEGGFTIGLGINDSSQVVGRNQLPSGDNRAFLYQDNTLHNLNSLIATNISPGWILFEARGINSKGQIVGVGSNSLGDARAFLLNPLPVGWEETITTQPSQPSYGNFPAKGAGKDSLVLTTHGWIGPSESAEASTGWVDSMSNSVVQYFSSHSITSWQVHGHKWIEKADTGILGAQKALENGKQQGKVLGDYLASQGWAHVHLIGHSAGASLIQAVSERLKAISPATTVHCTFLDPFVGFDFAGVSQYGKGADWSESYFSRDKITRIGGVITEGPFTESTLNYAYNVEVTPLDPHKIIGAKFRSSVTGELESCIKTLTSHDWPIHFYSNTIVGAVSSGYAGFGFPLSKEGGGWNNANGAYVRGNTPAQVLGTPDPTCTTEIQITPPEWVDTVIDFTQAPTVQSPTGTIQKWIESLKLFSGSPAWVSTVVSSTNPINLVSFNARFGSTNGAQGLVSVYWDDQVIGTIDERVATTNHYSFRFPNAVANSTHILGFRLDPFTNIQSVVTLTNILLNQVGVSQPFKLAPTTNTTNGARVYELTGESGFDYHVQASTNLVDWGDIAILANTNGLVRFYEQGSTNYPRRFYRAVAPY